MAEPLRRLALHRSLSARLLLLTAAFVLLGEILIYVPSIARFRTVYLEERIGAAHLATLSLEAARGAALPDGLEAMLLAHAGVRSVTLHGPTTHLMLGNPAAIERIFDLRAATAFSLIADAFDALVHRGQRVIRVTGTSPHSPAILVDISLSEQTLWEAMIDYSWRILALSIVLSLLTALLVYSVLRFVIVRPLERIAQSIASYRDRPEDPDLALAPSRRGDEIGLVQSELGRMQRGLTAALAQKARLAALGAAVSKINHDLRNLLANAMLLSDRLDQSQDPEVQRIAPRLVESMERAARLCSETLNFARVQAIKPTKARCQLAPLVEEVGQAIIGPGQDLVHWRNEVDADLVVEADRDQLFRVLMNLGRNAQQAMAEPGGLITITAWREPGRLVIEVADTGPGIPELAREHLFEAFAGSGRPGGTGLGLPIAREILRAHGGELELAHTGADGTAFRLRLPAR